MEKRLQRRKSPVAENCQFVLLLAQLKTSLIFFLFDGFLPQHSTVLPFKLKFLNIYSKSPIQITFLDSTFTALKNLLSPVIKLIFNLFARTR